MITASHNPPLDNGFKLCLPSGHLFPPRLVSELNLCIKQPRRPLDTFVNMLPEPYKTAKTLHLFVGLDTRLSSPDLLSLIPQTLNITCIGYCTTPMFSTYLRHYSQAALTATAAPTPTTPYLTSYLASYTSLLSALHLGPMPALPIDCSNGVAVVPLTTLRTALKCDALSPFNMPDLASLSRANLNTRCGSDYILTTKRPPNHYSGPKPTGDLVAAVDGDGDRIVFYTGADKGSDLFIFTGDHIAALLVKFVAPYVALLGSEFSVGVVLTLYSNSAVVGYYEAAGIPVAIAATGVVNLHHAAMRYDVGVYFESNGHGTIIFSDRVRRAMQGEGEAAEVMRCVYGLAHEMIGDAIPTAMIVPVILKALKLKVMDWARWWTDLPVFQSVVYVVDKGLMVTNADESKVVSPAAMQADIDAARGTCRCFVRASGTEDLVRVFVEGEGGEEVRGLVEEVVRLHCGARSKM